MTAKREINFTTKTHTENFIINNRNIIYLVVDWQHLRVVCKDRKEWTKMEYYRTKYHTSIVVFDRANGLEMTYQRTGYQVRSTDKFTVMTGWQKISAKEAHKQIKKVWKANYAIDFWGDKNALWNLEKRQKNKYVL